MRNNRTRPVNLLAFLVFVLPFPSLAALTRVGAPFPIVDESPCSSFGTELTVIANPLGPFEVVWVDGEAEVRSRLFTPTLEPAGPPVTVLPLHGFLFPGELLGTFHEGNYELAMNVVDFGTNPSSPLAAYRTWFDFNGNVVTPPVRIKPQRFVEIAPASHGVSLQLRSEPPLFGPPDCRSLGLLARAIDYTGAPLSGESRITRRASAWSGSHVAAESLPNDTFVAVYSTCQSFTGLVARRVNQNGLALGKPINFPLPGRVGNFAGGDLVLAARGRSFAVAAMVSSPNASASGAYTMAVVNNQVSRPRRITGPLAIAGVVDMAASLTGSGYLLLYQGASGDPLRLTLYAQELDTRGVPQGDPVAITEADELGVNGAVASLPDGRWLVVTRAQQGESVACTEERLMGTVLSSGS